MEKSEKYYLETLKEIKKAKEVKPPNKTKILWKAK